MEQTFPHRMTTPAPVPFDDQQLLRRAAEDDGRAFSALFERHHDGLRGFLYQRLRNQEDAEDAVVATFHNAWRARASYRGEASGKVWLYRIAARVALDMLRRRRSHPAALELDALSADAPLPFEEEGEDPGAMLLEAERTAEAKAAIRAALDRLNPDERRLIDLFYFSGYKYEQINALLGIPYTQVRGRLHRIRARLRRDLAERQQYQPA